MKSERSWGRLGMKFDTIKLSELAAIQTGPFGSQLHKEDYVVHGTPIVTVEHLGSRKFTEQNLPCVSDKDKERLKKYVLKTGDIVFSRVGSVDRCSYVSAEYEGWMFSGRCLRVRPCEKLNPEYLYYFFLLEKTKQFARNIATGATMPSINTKFMGEIPIRVPSLDAQNKIASILWMIDDKIELNKKINKNLEQQAEALFHSLFVENANPTWKDGMLSDLGTVVAGGTPSKTKPEYYSEQGIAWITPKDLSLNKSKFISHGEIDISELGFSKSSATKMPTGTVLFSSRAPIGYIAIAVNEVTTNQGFKSVVPNENIGTAFMYYLLKFLLPTIEGMASGSTFKEISGAGMKSVPVVIPDNETIEKFNTFCTPIFQQQEVLETENSRLTDIRDALLPKLMSGELDVSDIDL